ncbi:hypothetical protein L873DRAFT_1790247 [Choiromyces venosus 120613-1]|uniref:Uncharacterized protein n=1 Tax=Choiromyces venosus 120613-1 TaxID=1336337 RepID=A0A3N4JNS7_9PEZI|nr:hypothetical protein L873DRAFT_1790247 [Choiromyces venosus 120613-1]
MAGIIRLRPNRIVLTAEEVRNIHPRNTNTGSGSCSSSGAPPTTAAVLAWDHNITRRRARARASRRHCAETLDLYAPGIGEWSDGSVRVLEDGDAAEGWRGRGRRVGGRAAGGGQGVGGAVVGEGEDALILPFAELGLDDLRGEVQGEEEEEEEEVGERILHSDSDSDIVNASPDPSITTSSNHTTSTLGTREVYDEGPEDFIDISFLADIDFDAPDSSPPSPPTATTAYLDGATSTLASLDLSSPPSTGVKTPTSLRRFAERELSSPGDGVSGLSPRHKAVERRRLARYRDRSHSGKGVRLRRSRTAGGGFDGDDENSDSNDGSSDNDDDHNGDSSSIDGREDKGETEDVDAGTQTEKVEEGESAPSSSKKGEEGATTTAAATKLFR